MVSVRKFAQNITATWIGLAVHLVVTFALTPFILRELGETKFGIWTIATGLTGYYGLLDTGFRAGLTQFLARYLALSDFDSLNRTASTGFFVLSGLGVFLLLPTSLLVGYFAPNVFHFATDNQREAQWAISIMGISVAVQFVFFLFSAVLTATQRFDISNGIAIVSRLATAAATVFALLKGTGLVGLSVVTVVGTIVDYTLRWRSAYLVLPELKLKWGWVNRKSFREFAGFGVWNVLIVASRQIINYTDTLLIGFFLPMSAVTRYGLAASVGNYFGTVMSPVSSLFFPEMSRLDACHDAKATRGLILGGARFLAMAAMFGGLIIWFLCDNFFELWIGSEFTVPGGQATVQDICRLLVLAHLVTFGNGMLRQFLMGSQRVRLMALVMAFEAVLNLVLSVALIRGFGLYGVAAATAIGALVFQGLALAWIALPRAGLSSSQYVLTGWLRPVLVSSILALWLWFTDSFYPATSWAILSIQTGIAAAVGLLAILALGVNRTERARFLYGPLGKLRRRITESRTKAPNTCR